MLFVSCAEEEWKWFVYQGHQFHWDNPGCYQNIKRKRFCNSLIWTGLKLSVDCETEKEDQPLKFCATLLLNKCISPRCTNMQLNSLLLMLHRLRVRPLEILSCIYMNIHATRILKLKSMTVCRCHRIRTMALNITAWLRGEGQINASQLLHVWPKLWEEAPGRQLFWGEKWVNREGSDLSLTPWGFFKYRCFSLETCKVFF